MNSMERQIAPVPAGIHVQQPMRWEQAVAVLAEIAMQEDDCCLQMGDHLNAIEQQWGGRDRMRLAAREAGITWSLARQRSWVARRIPPDHPLRRTQLSYSHLRVLASTDAPLMWGNLALEKNWSVARLKEAIDRAGDRKAREDGYPCIRCEQPLGEETETVSFRIGQEKPARCCSLVCAAAYLAERAREEAFVL